MINDKDKTIQTCGLCVYAIVLIISENFHMTDFTAFHGKIVLFIYLFS